jgi:hypothetical protein
MPLFKNVNGVVVQMSAQEEAAALADQSARLANPLPVPDSVTNYQFRQALRNTSAATINAFITYVTGATQDIQDYWQYQPRIQRSHPNVEAVRVALGRTQANIDTFFRNASLIT